jgi:hypothetical protein
MMDRYAKGSGSPPGAELHRRGAGDALVQLYAATRLPAYLTGAENLAGWTQANTSDVRGQGGYSGGYAARGARWSGSRPSRTSTRTPSSACSPGRAGFPSGRPGPPR